MTLRQLAFENRDLSDVNLATAHAGWQAANDLKVHLGWAVQIYNTAEALPNLINPFWMLPLLGVLGLKARDIVGFTFLQLVVHLPIVLFLLWLLSGTLSYIPPVIPQ